MARQSDDSDAAERDNLILHRLNTGPSKRSIDGRPNDVSAYSDDDDEELGIPRRVPSPPMPVLDKTGRPEWLEDGIRATRSSRRLRMYLLLGIALLLAGVFAFAFTSGGSQDGPAGKVFQWAGDYWRGGSDKQAGSGGSPYLFPTDVGYPGPMATGKPADLADEDQAKATPTRGSSPISTSIPELLGFDAFSHMGPLTPYRSAPDFSISSAKYRSLPPSCHVDRVHILHRHGSRYPTTGSPAFLVKEMLKSEEHPISFSGPLAFLAYYDKDRLGSELLVGLGREQLYRSGVLHGMQYGHLVDRDIQKHDKILIRTGSQQRIVDSALAFLQGLFGAKWHHQTDLEVQVEAPDFNTTLAPNFACQRGEEGPGREWAQEWGKVYLKQAVDRLQQYAHGVTLDAKLLNGMQQLCSYDTVAFGRSDFCALFTKQEWLDYEYAWDLVFYGTYGDGTPVGKAQGVGWVNEFMSRLTKTAWDESTQTSENRTLNSNPTTFPVDRSFYADFTHDSTIAGVLSALNLPDFTASLPVLQPDANRKYKTSNLVPFAARLVFEEITCHTEEEEKKNDGSSSGSTQADTSLIRMLLNEAIVDLHQMKDCEKRDDGMCLREHFIASLAKRNEWSEWQNCTSTAA